MMHPRILYEIRDVIAAPLTFLFNLSMTSATLPSEGKTSTISVLHKKGNRHCIENYRPISLTCICCKIMESIVRDFTMNFFTLNKLFSDSQYGYIEGRSTVMQLLQVADSWIKSLEEGWQILWMSFILNLKRHLTKFQTSVLLANNLLLVWILL